MRWSHMRLVVGVEGRRGEEGVDESEVTIACDDDERGDLLGFARVVYVHQGVVLLGSNGRGVIPR